jgi:arylsulfatase A-like enzyme
MTSRWTKVWWAGLALGLLLLLLSSAPVLKNFFDGLGGTAVLASIRESGFVLPLFKRVAAFFSVACLLHLALGSLAVGLTWLTEQRYPQVATQRIGVTFLWFVALVIWVFAANAYWFPHAALVPHYLAAVRTRLGPVSLFAVVTCALALAVLWLAAGPVARRFGGMTRPARFAMAAFVALLATAPLFTRTIASTRSHTSEGLPHVIVIGADSLRLDQLRSFGGQGAMPVLDTVLAKSRVFEDTITPLARTYPSWVSILTGRHPRTTGAWFNLMPRDAVRVQPTIAHVLRDRGYATVFATDEVRFSNIDQSFGFDKLVTPTIGASDFVLGGMSDIPLVNLLHRTPLGRLLISDVYANRAVANTYRPADFSGLLASEVDFSVPTFLTVHFTASHWPYSWADSEHDPHNHNATFDQYRLSVRAVDRQIGELLELLATRGVLDNAYVIFLSDHGEAMAQPGDSIVRGGEPEALRRVVAHQRGHGTSVLSPSQYQVLLAVAAFGTQEANVIPGMSKVPASLEDVFPTVCDLLGIDAASLPFDGISLAHALRGQTEGELVDAHGRVRFTETDFTLPRMLAGDFNVKWLVEAGVPYYRVNPQSGWVELRQERLAEIVARKERAAIQGNRLLAALPTVTNATLYAHVNRDSGLVEVISDEAALAELPLYVALHNRFPGELGPPAFFGHGRELLVDRNKHE